MPQHARNSEGCGMLRVSHPMIIGLRSQVVGLQARDVHDHVVLAGVCHIRAAIIILHALIW